MAAIQYPDFFPCPGWQYGEQISSFAGRTPFECGWTRQRRAHPDQYTQISLSFEMPTAMYARWSTWVNASGYDWFTMRLDKFAGVNQPRDIRFIGPVDYVYDNFDNVRVTVPAEVFGELPNPEKPATPPNAREPGCLSWGVAENVLVAEVFWDPGLPNINEDEYNNRCDADLLIKVKDDDVYVYQAEDIIYTNTFNGDAMTTIPLEQAMPWDSTWADGEKILPGDPQGDPYVNRAWDYPSLTGLPLEFVMTSWKWVGNSLLCCFYNTRSDCSNLSYVLNRGGGNSVLHTGFGEGSSTEENDLREFYKTPPAHVVEEVRTFSTDPITILGTSFYTVYQDPNDFQHQWTAVGSDTSVTIANGRGSVRRLETINDLVLWFGPWAITDGGTQQDTYGYISLGFLGSTANSFVKEWDDPDGAPPPAWYPTTPENYPTRGGSTDWIAAQLHNVLPNTYKQRPARFFKEAGTDVMVAGTVNDWFIYKWTSIDSNDPNFGATEIDLSPEKSFTNVAIVECQPVEELGAYVLAQLNTANLQRVNINISTNAEPGSWSETVELTLSSRMHVNNRAFHIDYSKSQGELLITYRSENFNLVIDKFVSPFVCLLYEE